MTYNAQEQLDEELRDALLDDDDEKVIKALDAGADLNARYHNKDTILIKAIDRENEVIYNELIKRGADIHAIGELGRNALNKAIAVENNKLAERLLDMNINIITYPETDYDLLSDVVLFKNMEKVLQKLLDRGMNPEGGSPASESPLSYAISEGHMEYAKILMRAGADYSRHREPVFLSELESMASLVNAAFHYGPKYSNCFGEDGKLYPELLDSLALGNFENKIVAPLIKSTRKDQELLKEILGALPEFWKRRYKPIAVAAKKNREEITPAQGLEPHGNGPSAG